MKFTKPSISVHGNDYLTKLVIEEALLSKNSVFNYCNALFNLIKFLQRIHLSRSLESLSLLSKFIEEEKKLKKNPLP